ncbi:MAG: tRNA threonylcarbamoyladenosine biosynthesis protein TsaB [Desulforhopalus sp.]|jgi:tRNA threonylcarbamoyladenosine biosynthesis protein TsaB
MESGQPVILAIDTATPATSLALTRGTSKDGEVLASLGLSSNVTHSRRLLTSIEWLMAEVDLGWTDIDGIGVSLGPGSFTGLRIGMATAKGLAMASGLSLIGVSTLDSLAAKCVTRRLICSVLDARKKEVYAGFYRVDSGGTPTRIGEIVALSPQDLVLQINEPVFLIGDGAVVYRDVFQELLGEDVELAAAHLNEPSATSLGMLSAEQFLAGALLDIDTAVPLYVRSSDAELNLKKKKEALAAVAKGNN